MRSQRRGGEAVLSSRPRSLSRRTSGVSRSRRGSPHERLRPPVQLADPPVGLQPRHPVSGLDLSILADADPDQPGCPTDPQTLALQDRAASSSGTQPESPRHKPRLSPGREEAREGGPSSLGRREGSNTSRGCAGIIAAEQHGGQSAFRATAARLARIERKLVSASPGARNR